VFAEKIRAAGLRYGRPIHWFIMTSHQNHAATEAFFQPNATISAWIASQVHFFRQGRMPAVISTERSCWRRSARWRFRPDGHGGSLRALERSGALDLMAREGIDILSYFQVDNPLVRCIDPTFIGWHVVRGSEMSSKMVPKAYAAEKVGHFCTQRGKTVVVEYSDLPMPPCSAESRCRPAASLRYLAGSIAIHVLDREFVRADGRGRRGCRAAVPSRRQKDPDHRRRGTAGEAGEAQRGQVRDVCLRRTAVCGATRSSLRRCRADDFSPVKNAEGLDSPQTCRDDQMRQFARWLNAHGAGLAVDATGRPVIPVEVSPLFGYDEDSFADAWRRLPAPPVAGPAGLLLD
jgi:UDP-N-acetylglucosamine/UDP-N-acetylgalactosamine diphosphorylase